MPGTVTNAGQRAFNERYRALQEQAAGKPNPNSDKEGPVDLLDQLKRAGYLIGCLDRRDDVPSKHMLFSGLHQDFQDQYLRGRRDQNAEMLKVDGGA